MGARSQIAGLMAAGAIVLVLLFLTGPIADLPKAVLGAVIVGPASGWSTCRRGASCGRTTASS